MYIVEDDIDMCGQSLRKRNEKRKRDSGGSYDSFSFISLQEGGPTKKRCTLDSNTSNHTGWSNSEVHQNTFHNNIHPTWPSTTVPSYVAFPINSSGTTNILGTNTLNTNILGNIALGNHTLGNHTLGNHTLGTNILGANTLGNHTLGTNMLGTNTLVPGTPSLEVQTKSNGWNNELGLCITIRTLSGKAVEIRIKPTDRVKDIKELIYCNEGIPPEQQRLVFKGHVMADEKYVSDYGVLNGSLIHMVLALRGGCHASLLNGLVSQGGDQTSFLNGIVSKGSDQKSFLNGIVLKGSDQKSFLNGIVLKGSDQTSFLYGIVPKGGDLTSFLNGIVILGDGTV